MDDPVSALDSNVKQKVFKEVFLGELKNKTRILVTHAVEFLHLADRIVIMENGRVKSIGTFEELECIEEIKNVIQTISKTNAETNIKLSESEESDSFNSKNGDKKQKKKNYLSKDMLRLIEDENKEVVDICWSSYIDMFMKDWGWLAYLIGFPFLGLYCYFGTFIVYY